MPNKLKTLTLISIGLTLLVVMLGAYTRLKDAGLGCPDWPGCYGKLLAPTSTTQIPSASPEKAWIEMIHRYIAGTLGLLVLGIFLFSLFVSNAKQRLWPITTIILGLVIWQALLGMWTVTLKLFPVVVMGHLLGGFAILSFLWWFYLRFTSPNTYAASTLLRSSTYVALVALCLQIMLGGWTSANYAAVVCADFPTCQGAWWPHMDWAGAFDFFAIGIFDSPGTPLENTSRVTIQMAHRLGALLATCSLVWLIYLLFRSKNKSWHKIATIIMLLLIIQASLGISNVVFGLPLPVSLLHNLGAALLLMCIIYVLHTVSMHAKNS